MWLNNLKGLQASSLNFPDVVASLLTESTVRSIHKFKDYLDHVVLQIVDMLGRIPN